MDRAFIRAAVGKNRSRTEITATILTVAQNGERQVNIMKQSHLNSTRLRFYLNELTKFGLIETTYAEGARIYTTSQKGTQYILQYNRISNLLK